MTLIPWPLDEPFPASLTDAQLMRALQMKRSAFCEAKKRGAFKRFLLDDIGLRSDRYCGKIVRRYIDKEPINSFGRRSLKAALVKVMTTHGVTVQ